MWQEFFKFELRYQLRQPFVWGTTATLVLIAFLSASSDGFRIGGAIGNIHMNAPVVIARQLAVLSMAAMFLLTVFLAGAVLRDGEVGMAELLFATPVRQRDYLLGRFLAGLAVCLLIFSLITVAMMAGSRMPFIDPQRIGPFCLKAYGWSFLTLVVPNLLFVAALLLFLAATTGSLLRVYVGVLAFFVLWSMAGALASHPGADSIAVLLDPFAVRAILRATRYYSSAESNTQLPALSGLLLQNRLLWTALSTGLFAATVVLFKPQLPAGRERRSRARVRPAPAATTPGRRSFTPRFSAATAWTQCLTLLRLDTLGVLRSLPFLIMLLLALANFVANMTVGGLRFDSTPYPLTRLMLEELAGGINQGLVLILIFYSGELIFKDRQSGMSVITECLPVPAWVPLVAKCGALLAVILTFLASGVAAAVAIQLLRGGAPIEGVLYVKGTLIGAAYFALMALALLAVQVLCNHKFLGVGLGLALILSPSALTALRCNHRLVSFAELPPLQYSDLNGYGHFLVGWSWFAAYWALFCLAFLLLAQAFSARGEVQGRRRLRQGLRALRGRAGMALGLTLAAWGAAGGFIFYNTNVLNRYESVDAAFDAQAEYEKTYRALLATPQPSLIRIRAEVDIFPAERSVRITGHYVLQNKTGADLDTLQLQTDPATVTTLVNLPPHEPVQEDPRFGMRIVKLTQPLSPGATLPLDFTVQVHRAGFTNSGAPDPINYNGTLFTLENFFPLFGYNQSRELTDRVERRKRGLGEPHGLPKLDDPQAGRHNVWKLWGIDGDFIDFEATVSTSADQLAVAPGSLLRQWEADGRRYFHYKMDRPILPFLLFQSARWEVRKADWNGVPIEVFYDKKHPYNIDRMIRGTRAALDYLSANFGAYPDKQVRITEFPLYQGFARSFPGTIPFSESLGFISDLRDPAGVDHVFYVTAHEVAHEWWGDQAIAANVQGSGLVTESLAEYSALMTVEKALGSEMTRHILRYDLDAYLSGRGKELGEEQPLYKSEHQAYVEYRKGSLIFYRLREEIGEAALNRALQRFVAAHRYQTSPYVTSLTLLEYIRAETPPDKQDLLTDMFERIVLYDNRVTAASARRRADGQWEVTAKLHLHKTQADGKGRETARAYDEPIEVAVFARAAGAPEKEERVLYRAKHRLPGGESTVTLLVGEKPLEVGVDPYLLLIDRNAGDNRKVVSGAD